MTAISKIFTDLLRGLSPRQKGVVLSRFGLEKSEEGKTLAAIGKKLGLTRERVRQIENSALKAARAGVGKSGGAAQFVLRVRRELERAGGAAGKTELLRRVSAHAAGVRENHLDFLAEASGGFASFAGDSGFKPFYHLGKNEFEQAVNFVNSWVGHLSRRKEKVLAGDYGKELDDFVKAKRIGRDAAESYLCLSNLIHTNIFGDTGLAAWPEIRPATSRDRAYLILKKKNKPLHFREITKEINEAGLSLGLALAPTVHNELIKDPRFVLVGRGIYALAERGYEPGVARDVIKRTLKKHGPLRPDAVFEYVSKERVLKPNTILVSLQNKNHFERLADGRYRVREA